MTEEDPRLEEARQRALLISGRIRQRSDLDVRRTIEDTDLVLDYENNLENLAIAPEAWHYVISERIDPKLVFAHPIILQGHPETSLYYRGIATLSLKRVQTIAVSVNSWEGRGRRRQPALQSCQKVARLYNAVISVVITGSDGWTLENGYRSVLATIGITEDGKLRNIVGQEGENAVKERILKWLQSDGNVPVHSEGLTTILRDDASLRMVYSSEPDISFEELADGAWEVVSTIEIKSGTDPAGALERLGAVQKSFEATPARSKNFVILGVVTPEMRRRLNELPVQRDFSLYRILNDPDAWDDFIREIFHHTLRVI